MRLIWHMLDFLAVEGHADQKWLQSAFREPRQRAVVVSCTIAKSMPTLIKTCKWHQQDRRIDNRRICSRSHRAETRLTQSGIRQIFTKGNRFLVQNNGEAKPGTLGAKRR